MRSLHHGHGHPRRTFGVALVRCVGGGGTCRGGDTRAPLPRWIHRKAVVFGICPELRSHRAGSHTPEFRAVLVDDDRARAEEDVGVVTRLEITLAREFEVPAPCGLEVPRLAVVRPHQLGGPLGFEFCSLVVREDQRPVKIDYRRPYAVRRSLRFFPSRKTTPLPSWTTLNTWPTPRGRVSARMPREPGPALWSCFTTASYESTSLKDLP